MTAPAARATMPPSPRLFLVDGYALIYRAFFALISRPLTTSRGENTSAAWGVVNFLQRLVETHRPDYLGWVLDSGLSFRHERYPAYKATREKLTEELQSDFDRGMERIRVALDAYHIPVLSLHGYEADDVIGTLALQGVDAGVSVVVVSGDKDFQQLVRPGIWLLNPGRGGAAAVEEQWVSVENGSERLGVPPERVTDYLALVGDSSDNVPGVKGIGDKTAQELVNAYGSLDDILAHAAELTKKRPREALLEHGGLALLSKELVTIRVDLPIGLELEKLRLQTPDYARLRGLYVELEFHSLARNLPVGDDAPDEEATAVAAPPTDYATVDTLDGLADAIDRARAAPYISIDVEGVVDAGAPQANDPLRTTLAGLSIAVGPGEAYYFPLAHRPRNVGGQVGLGLEELMAEERPDDAAGAKRPRARKVAEPTSSRRARWRRAGRRRCRFHPSTAPSWRRFARCSRIRRSTSRRRMRSTSSCCCDAPAVTLRGLDFDTMVASYVLDPGRRSHALDQLALEFLDRKDDVARRAVRQSEGRDSVR